MTFKEVGMGGFETFLNRMMGVLTIFRFSKKGLIHLLKNEGSMNFFQFLKIGEGKDFFETKKSLKSSQGTP